MLGEIVILGVFVADTSYRADRMPKMGETILGNNFALGPGGKGSNQAVAAARAGGRVQFMTRLGQDAFADIALSVWNEAGIIPVIEQDPDSYTGAAYIFVEEASGDNAIIICPGVAETIDRDFVETRANLISGADVFMTQLEQPVDAGFRALEVAREGGTTTILNPAPAANLPDGMLALCDYVTPNESEAEALTGVSVRNPEEARAAAAKLLSLGAGAAIITLGENGVLFHDGERTEHVPAFHAGKVVETTGAGDAFNGAFAAALVEGVEPVEAVRFGCACAAISVTKPGTAPSMPMREEIEALLNRSPASLSR
ncbi:ribokinase [Pseudoruegeria sp. HB172150]|uniref:ribokinase n=1 Tax=Pseudoruegeria sp. HB172150 TaxID=2721164 RepID=UPI0015581484|nr:ribokinase [Pseudoruegeria sp. HB172150]